MNDDNYIVVPIRFLKVLGLKGNELLVFSLIYGFSQDGESVFMGSIKYIQETLNLSRETVRTVLNSLVKAKLIVKIDKEINGVKFCDYRANLKGMQEISIPYKKQVRGMQEISMGGIPKTCPHNIDIHNIEDNNKSTKVDSSQTSLRPCKKESFDVKKFIVFFNAEMDKHDCVIPRLKSLQGNRLNFINARIKEHGKESLMLVVQKAATSDFLNGKNDRGWIATFSWIVKPNNYIKVLEGNFDNTINDYGSSKQELKDKRRGFEVTATSAEDYSTTF